MGTVLVGKAEELSISGIFPQLLQVEQQVTHQEGPISVFAAMSAMQ